MFRFGSTCPDDPVWLEALHGELYVFRGLVDMDPIGARAACSLCVTIDQGGCAAVLDDRDKNICRSLNVFC
jgi:hypothetical protein